MSSLLSVIVCTLLFAFTTAAPTPTSIGSRSFSSKSMVAQMTLSASTQSRASPSPNHSSITAPRTHLSSSYMTPSRTDLSSQAIASSDKPQSSSCGTFITLAPRAGAGGPFRGPHRSHATPTPTGPPIDTKCELYQVLDWIAEVDAAPAPRALNPDEVNDMEKPSTTASENSLVSRDGGNLAMIDPTKSDIRV